MHGGLVEGWKLTWTHGKDASGVQILKTTAICLKGASIF